jgi:arsenate reductase
MSDTKYNVLFLCTGNSARSVISEALLNRWGSDKFQAYSAGRQPKGEVHPKTIKILEKNNYSTDNFSSKSWDEFTKPDAPEIDFVITVCSNAANETCPVFLGSPFNAHWDIDDPAREFESEQEQDKEFQKVFIELEHRIQALTNLPKEKLNKVSLQTYLEETSD